MKGFIYILSNPTMPGLLKIGKSSKDPAGDRIRELYTTSAPQPFTLEYAALVSDFDSFEVAIHRQLQMYRPNPDREFFSISVEEAISVIKNAGVLHDEIFSSSREQDYRGSSQSIDKNISDDSVATDIETQRLGRTRWTAEGMIFRDGNWYFPEKESES